MHVAVDLAAMDGLLKIWGVSNRVFSFDNHEIPTVSKMNHSISSVCGERYEMIATTNDKSII